MARTLLLVLLVVAGSDAPADVPDPPDTGAVRTTTPGGIRIHALHTGFVRIKRSHEEMGWPAALRIPKILLDWRWAEWMPVISYAIEHPETTVLVDTGVELGAGAPGYYGEDERNAFFYERNLRFHVTPEGVLEARLRAAGIDPARVDHVLVTHFHADHVGGFAALPNATVHVGPGNWPSHVGAFTIRLPEGFEPAIVAWRDEPFGAFEQSFPLSADGAVRLVPLPGHTPGHAGLLVRDGGLAWLVAGDATFSLDQTERGAISGVSEDVDAARASQARIRAQLALEPTRLLPAHDPAVFELLGAPPPAASRAAPGAQRADGERSSSSW